MFNLAGEVIGVVSRIVSRSGGSEGQSWSRKCPAKNERFAS